MREGGISTTHWPNINVPEGQVVGGVLQEGADDLRVPSLAGQILEYQADKVLGPCLVHVVQG